MAPFSRFHATRCGLTLLTSLIALGGAIAAQGAQTATAAPTETVDFKHDIAPIFAKSCSKCHGPDMAMARLRLDSEASVLKGGASGPAIVPGKSGASLLIKRILGVSDAPRMPMGAQPLPDDQVKLLKAWIDHADFSSVQTASAGATPEAASAAAPGKQSPLFAEKIRPILAARCYQCHGPETQQNGLRLDSLAGILKGSDNGHIVVPGHSDQSRLVRRLMAQERPQMPYGGPPLSDSQIELVRQWIDEGAPGPDSAAPVASLKPQKHWAYVKPVEAPLPEVKDKAWPRNAIDNFILAKLEKEGLKPSPEADKATLIRRVYLDLIGLPPTPSKLTRFWRTAAPAPMRKSLTAFWPPRITGNDGPGLGSISPATPTRTATKRTPAAPLGNIATG